MNQIKIKQLLAISLSLAIFMTSCQKDEATPDGDTGFSNDDAFAEGIFDDVSNIADEAYDLGSDNLKSGNELTVYLGSCAEITLDTVADPRELIIDFGEENCLCNDGKYRRGKIIISFTGRYKKPGSVITTGFDDYYVNDHQVDGTKVVTNMGENEDGNPYFSIVVTGVVYLADDGGTLSWNANKTRTWVEGYETRRIRDDVYLIDGSADGIRPSGITWEREIVNALRKEMNCRWIVSGTVEITPEDRPTRILDYGDGTCDNIATVIINGVTYTITLR